MAWGVGGRPWCAVPVGREAPPPRSVTGAAMCRLEGGEYRGEVGYITGHQSSHFLFLGVAVKGHLPAARRPPSPPFYTPCQTHSGRRGAVRGRRSRLPSRPVRPRRGARQGNGPPHLSRSPMAPQLPRSREGAVHTPPTRTWGTPRQAPAHAGAPRVEGDEKRGRPSRRPACGGQTPPATTANHDAHGYAPPR